MLGTILDVVLEDHHDEIDELQVSTENLNIHRDTTPIHGRHNRQYIESWMILDLSDDLPPAYIHEDSEILQLPEYDEEAEGGSE